MKNDFLFKQKKSVLLFFSLMSAVTLSASNITAYFGDRLLQRTVIIDVNDMSLIKDIVTAGEGHYSVNAAGDLPKVYVDTRKSNYLEVIDTNTNTYQKKIILPHKVRSSDAYNPFLRVQLVAASDKPMTSLIDIDTDTVIASVGDNTVYPPNGDYGGGNATGHPFWLTKRKFVILDRPNRKIHIYKVERKNNGKWKVKHLSSKKTPTAIHHMIKGKKENTFFALAEGSPTNNIAPALIKYKLKGKKLIKKSKVFISKINISNLGAHHMDLHPNGKIMYIGSTEGNMYIIKISKRKMKVIGSIAVGKGAGHTTFIPERNIAIVTNHKDTFLSVIDTTDHTLIKNIEVSGPQINNAILQSHTSFIHPNGNYFYSFATDNGIFYEVDLNSLSITRTLNTGGTPLQGVFINN